MIKLVQTVRCSKTASDGYNATVTSYVADVEFIKYYPVAIGL